MRENSKREGNSRRFLIGLNLLQRNFSLDEISLAGFSFDGICIKETVTLKLSFIMNTTQIVEQDQNRLGEINIEEADSSSKCKAEVRYFKYWAKPRRYTEKVVKSKKVKEIITHEIRRDRNRTSQRNVDKENEP